jgi:hypothetical protein
MEIAERRHPKLGPREEHFRIPGPCAGDERQEEARPMAEPAIQLRPIRLGQMLR